MNKYYYLFLVGIIAGSSLYAKDDIFDESLTEILATKSELKADIGSRDGARNYLESNTPIDVITYKQIEQSGLTSLTDVLRYFVAGFNAPETSVADGSDHVRAYTLRGMSPDQVLVLLNGKRVHTSSLLHVNGVIGRGSSHVDLDTIALGAIEKVEILRDGAAAQYGSDAIAGVINIILKGASHKSYVAGQYGKRRKGDGQKIEATAFVALPLNYDGFFNLTMQAIGQEKTQRAGADRRLTPARVETHVGIPESTNYKAIINAEVLHNYSVDIYTNAYINYRDSKASAFYRPPDANLSNPNGFLPMINAKILDYAFSVGAKGNIGEYSTWDFSNSYGYNNIHYYVDDSMNYALGATSPNSFDNGSLSFVQNTTNLDLKMHKDNLKIAGGIEFRYENYQINSGELASYTNINRTNAIATVPAGSQGFAGFSRENAVDASRTSYALYVDNVIDLSKKLQLQVLARYEEYSDFGESTNAKLALSYKLNPEVLLRTSASTGFRAPSLAQSYYSQNSSFVSADGNLTTEGTFRVNHALAKELGSKDLKSERSKNFSVGSVYQPTRELSFALDYFYIEVNDRILLTQNISTTAAQEALYGVSAARYFTNAAQTKTQGFDFRTQYEYNFKESSKLNISLWINYTKNSISDAREDTSTYVEEVRVEDGQPKSSVKLLTSYEVKKITTALNLSRYGAYSQAISNKKYEFDPAFTVDLDLSYKVSKKTTIAIGGQNIFDTIPNKWNGLSGDFYGNDGIKPYSRYSPFGYSGAYYYLRASMEF